MTVVIAGATGLTGSHLLKLLVDDARVDAIICVGRRPSGSNSPKVRDVVVADLAEIIKRERMAELAGDVYYCCLGTTMKDAKTREKFVKIDYTAVIDFARVAKHNHARAFVVVSASSANANSPIFYSCIKGETEDVLKKLGLQFLVIFQPALLMGERAVKRGAEKFFIKTFSALQGVLPRPLKKRMMTPVDLLARRMLDEGLRVEPPAPDQLPTQKTIEAIDI